MKNIAHLLEAETLELFVRNLIGNSDGSDEWAISTTLIDLHPALKQFQIDAVVKVCEEYEDSLDFVGDFILSLYRPVPAEAPDA